MADRPQTRRLIFLLGDQLSPSMSSLADADRARDVLFLCEVAEETTYVRHHKQKIVFILSAMRHFADEMRADGWTVDYVTLDDPANTGSFFLDRNSRKLAGNHRLAQIYRNWGRMDHDKRQAYLDSAAMVLKALDDAPKTYGQGELG